MKSRKKGVLTFVAGGVAGCVAAAKIMSNTIGEKDGKVDKFKGYYNLLNQWLIHKQESRSLTEYFEAQGYQSIAIYGMGELGQRLYNELKDSSVNVKYAIDKNPEGSYIDLEVITSEEKMEEVDVIVVTAIYAFDEIKQSLSEQTEMKIISLEDVVFDM